jgi:hypothetical protein
VRRHSLSSLEYYWTTIILPQLPLDTQYTQRVVRLCPCLGQPPHCDSSAGVVQSPSTHYNPTKRVELNLNSKSCPAYMRHNSHFISSTLRTRRRRLESLIRIWIIHTCKAQRQRPISCHRSAGKVVNATHSRSGTEVVDLAVENNIICRLM